MTARSARFRPRARPGPGRRAGFALACLLVLSLTFLFGLLVGRQWARSYRGEAEVEKGKRVALAGRTASEDLGRRQAEIQEKLTFYRTLTAPLTPSPPRPSPTPRDSNAQATGAGNLLEDRGHSGGLANAPPPDGRGQSPGQAWTVQVAAYGSQDPADALQRSLAAAGYDAYVVPFTGEDGKIRYRVRVGSYPNRDEARNASERLRAERAVAPLIVPR